MAITQTLELTCISQNIMRNTSQVRILWQSTQTGTSQVPITRTATYRIQTNGGTWKSYIVGYALPADATVTVLDTTVEVPHKSDGSGSVAVQTQMDTGGQSVTRSANLTLEPIAQHSQVSATHAVIGGTCTLTVQRKNSRYTHSLRIRPDSKTAWYYIDSSGGLSDRETTYSQDVVSVTIPEFFYDSIPNAKYGTATVECRTCVDGEKFLSQASRTTFRYSSDDRVCKPTVQCSVTDSDDQTVAVTGDASVLVRYRSCAVCELTPQVYRGATLRQEPGVQYLGQWYFGERVELPELETDKLQLKVHDSRGYTTVQALDLAEQFVPYVPLTATASARRNSATGGEVALSVWGNCYTGDLGQTPNAFAVAYRIDEGDWVALVPQVEAERYTVQAVLNGLDYETSYHIQVQVSDSFTQLVRNLEIAPSVPVFEWGEGDFAFHVPLTIQGSPLADFVVEQGMETMSGNGTWYWRKWESGKAECYGHRDYGTLEADVAWGSMYTTANLSQDFPTGLFSTVPEMCVVNPYHCYPPVWVSQGYYAIRADNTGIFCMVSPQKVTMENTTISFHAIGRWK